jgi:hypothetical protein
MWGEVEHTGCKIEVRQVNTALMIDNLNSRMDHLLFSLES